MMPSTPEVSEQLFDVAIQNLQHVPDNLPGISVFHHSGFTNFAYKTNDKTVVGILTILSSGEFVILVRSDYRRQGVGTALLTAADCAIGIEKFGIK